MALVLKNRVQETTTTSGTGSVTLLGAVPSYQSFAVIGNGNTCYYTIVDTLAWEVGIGTYSTTGPTLARTTILSNSNGNTSPINLSGNTSLVWVDYPSEKSVNLDASDNVSALGTVTSGTWNGSTIPVAYGGTGVTSSSGANSVVLRDANANAIFNNFIAGFTAVTAAAGTTVLTVASTRTQVLIGSTTQTIQLPDATTLQLGQSFIFVNNSSGFLTITNNAGATIDTVPSGGVAQLGATSIATNAGTWGIYSFLPGTYNFSIPTADFGNATITNATWQGGTIQSGYGGTGLTTFGAANYALYSTSSSALAAGTLPVAAGGTGQVSFTSGYVLYGNGTGALSSSANMTFNGTALTLANDFTTNGIKIGKGPGSLSNNIFISQFPNTTVSGTGNVGIGGMFNLTSGTLNQGFGTGSLNSLTTGTGNQAYGYGAGSSISTSASYNQLYGLSAGQYITGSYNTVLGAYTGLTGVLSSGQSNHVVLADGNGTVKEYFDSLSNEFLTGNYRTNSDTMGVTQTIATGQNTMSAGPITISDGVTVTLADGANWVIV
jgi:hypothetical protein